jgi:hypothetical protein
LPLIVSRHDRLSRNVHFGLKNIGRAVARAPYLAISTAPPFKRSPYGIDGNHHQGMPRLVHESPMPPWRYGATADDVIHPSVARDVARLTRENSMTLIAPEGALITYSIACEGMPLIEGTHLVPVADLQ